MALAPGSWPAVELDPVTGGKTVTPHPRPGPELDTAQREAEWEAEWERFRLLTGQIEAVNEAICDAPGLQRSWRGGPLTAYVLASAGSGAVKDPT